MHDHGQEPKARADARGPVRDGRTAGSQTAAQAQAARTGGTLTPQSVLALQRGIGNAEIGRLLELQRHTDNGGCCGGPEPEDRHSGNAPIQRSTVHDVLRSPGKPLPEALRSEMEARMGANFRDVVIHDNAAAARSAVEVNADAYTANKNHIVVGPRGLNKRTLAHELTHVEQQRAGAVAGTDNGNGLRVSDPSDRFERAAEANAARVMARTPRAPEMPETHEADLGPEAVSEPHTSLQRSSAYGRNAAWSGTRGPFVQRGKRAGGAAAATVADKARTKATKLRGTKTRKEKGREKAEEEKKAKGKDRFGGQSVDRRFRPVVAGLGYSRTGMWTDKITVSGTRSFKRSPDEQTLRHLSTQLYWYAKELLEQKDEQEFQAMYVNGGIVVASNLDSSVQAVYDKLNRELDDYVMEYASAEDGEEPADPFEQMLTTTQHDGDVRAETVANKFGNLKAGTRPVRDGAEEMLYSIQGSGKNNLLQADMSGIAAVIDSGAITERIAFLSGGSSFHAEQKLVLALQKTSGGHSAWIAGKKRPCMSCLATLTYARDRGGMRISFQERPGGYFLKGNPGLVALGKALGHVDGRMEAWLDLWTLHVTSHKSFSIGADSDRSNMPSEYGVTPSLSSSGMDADYGSGSDSDAEETAASSSSTSTSSSSSSSAASRAAARARFRKRYKGRMKK
ncbi:eCIS core domain-containing protein [Streptomyces sp. 3214.6]|uniref:eCIS core domain-containing protein n=1 Tax=Streptomyces sp. 3214.6 TaxID=1882757 RepID=UPI00090C92AB|nr:DUF4157 domain-containing protein [Streptomyces sp. 3214.6]SHH84921.1 protein of unknown function [Streptomyces sp. 3214.6]